MPYAVTAGDSHQKDATIITSLMETDEMTNAKSKTTGHAVEEIRTTLMSESINEETDLLSMIPSQTEMTETFTTMMDARAVESPSQATHVLEATSLKQTHELQYAVTVT